MSTNFKVKLDIKDTETEAFFKELVTALPGYSISSNGSPCDVMVLEIGADLNEEFRLVEQIRAKGIAREIYLTSARQDPEVLLRALKAGIREFFPQPINKAEVAASLDKLKRSAEAEGSPKSAKRGLLISVVGSKGGVGATTVAVNLAVSLKEMAGEKSVVLMDMNPLLGGVQLYLDIQTSFSWAEGAKDIARMDSTYLLNTLYKHPTGIHVLPAPSRPAGADTPSPDTMERLVGLMRSAFDIIIMDGSRSFDDLSLRMLGLSETILVVSELNFPSLVNAKKLLDVFDGLGISYGKDIKAVINRYQKKTMVSLGEAEKTLGRKIVSMIPNDYETTMSAINTGKTLSDVAWKSSVMENFRELAALLLHKELPKKEKSLFPLSALGFIGMK
ncbi:MAG TPA: AAA family ATPase [Nitrospirota bacterium]